MKVTVPVASLGITVAVSCTGAVLPSVSTLDALTVVVVGVGTLLPCWTVKGLVAEATTADQSRRPAS